MELANRVAKSSTSSRKLTVDELVQGLLAEGYISAQNAKMMQSLARPQDVEAKGALRLLAEKNWANEKKSGSRLDQAFLAKWLAGQVGLEYFNIDPLKTDVAAVTAVVPYAYAKRYRILPVKVLNDEIVVATAEPFETVWVADISHLSNKNISFVISSPEDIERYALEFFNLSKSVKRAEVTHDGSNSGVQNLEQLMEIGRKGNLDANDHHIVNIVDWLLQYAFQQRSSDIHLEPRRGSGNVRFRIDGVLHQVYEMPGNILTAVTSRLKILGRMDVAEKRRPQDGRLKTVMPDGLEVELRLSTMPTAFGEKMVMRIFDPSVLVKTFEELGFPKQDSQKWQKMIKQPHGIILVTGPTGSGKTTTLYSTLRQLATPEVNVCTVEDPIELVEPSFNQMQVQQKINVNFASGIKTLLRQDPDIIMIGEIRDLETAEMAIQASLTGHLVLSTLHTNDAPSAITRLIELGIPAYLINATVLGVVAQRLVRTLCPHCKKTTEINPLDWKGLTSPWKLTSPKRSCVPVGCLECRNTGFMGRTGIYEIFLMDDGLREVAQEGMDLRLFRQAAIKTGMIPLRISGAQKVSQGMTTIEEVLKVAPPSLDMVAKN